MLETQQDDVGLLNPWLYNKYIILQLVREHLNDQQDFEKTCMLLVTSKLLIPKAVLNRKCSYWKLQESDLRGFSESVSAILYMLAVTPVISGRFTKHKDTIIVPFSGINSHFLSYALLLSPPTLPPPPHISHFHPHLDHMWSLVFFFIASVRFLSLKKAEGSKDEGVRSHESLRGWKRAKCV